jgi:hypothetical protein
MLEVTLGIKCFKFGHKKCYNFCGWRAYFFESGDKINLRNVLKIAVVTRRVSLDKYIPGG